MTNLLDWDEEDLAVDPEAEYRMLLNGLRRTEGFGLFFVQCSLAGGGQIMQRVEADLVDQSMALLKLSSEIEDGNVFKCIQKILTVRSDIQILFIQGLELSLLDYEESKKRLGWSSEKIFSYSWHGVPPVLINLNQQRECFRDRFNTRLVFLLPLFAVKYLVHRAPDFFDWRSGVAQFNDDVDTLNLESLRTQSEGDYHQYLSWTHAQRNHRLLEIQSLLEVEGLDAQKRYNLYFKQGNLFIASTDFEAAISAYDAALDIEPDNHAVLNNKGSALGDLGRYEDAVAVYDAILVSKPDDYTVLNSKGILLCDFLGRYEEALNCFEQALALKPDDHSMLHNKGVALSYLNRYEAAISACDSALTIKPDQHKALHNKGVALDNLGRYEEAISAYEAALEIEPNRYEVLHNKSNALKSLGRYEEAIFVYDAVLAIRPEDHATLNNKGVLLCDFLGSYEEALNCFEQALALKPDDYATLHNTGVALSHLDRYEAAISACDSALALKPDSHVMLHRKGNALKNLSRYKEAVSIYNTALEIKPDYPEVLSERGVVYWTIGDLDKALNDFEQALVLQPDNKLVVAQRASILLQIGDESQKTNALADVINAMSAPEILEQIQRGLRSGLSEGQQKRIQEIRAAFNPESKAMDLEALQTQMQTYQALAQQNPEAWGCFTSAAIAAINDDSETVIVQLQTAVQLLPEYRELLSADMDSWPDAIRDDPRFQALLS